MSIASALIHATMSNVTRDMKQLEHLLGSLAAAPLAAAPLAATPLASTPSMPSEVSSTTSDDIMRSLHAQQTLLDQLKETVQQFTTTLHAQQHTIHHLTDRIQILEETRAVPETWMDPPIAIEEEEEEIVPIYIVRKTEEPVDQEIKQEALLQVTGQSIWKKESAQEVQEEEEVEEEESEEEEVQEEEVQEEEIQEEEVPVKVEVPVKEEVPAKQEVPVKEEVEEEEEEEEGMELEVITFQGVSYYKDEEGFIYSIDEDEQPSEKAIGYWKKKAQAIAFYRSE